jgi:tetratricopeptide (TPR) repeat protein
VAKAALREMDSTKANANFQKAIAVWEKNRTVLINKEWKANATYYTAASYQGMKDYDNAILVYQELIKEFPTYKKAWFGQYQIAQIYELYMKQGKSSAADVKQAYQELLEKYPTCSAVKSTTKKLATL